ncbi:MAG: glycosyltransferase, partial [bacterium]
MSDQKAKITVVTPALNEKFFIRGWLENVKRFADEIIVCDTGSIDSTYMFLYKAARKDNRVHVYLWHDVNFRPYE